MSQRTTDITVRRGPYPEFTWAAVLVGWAIGAVIAVSIGYAALILGFSIEGSELAAILGWGILRGLMGRTSIVENNINQTIASAVNGASSGIMFSVPALFILSKTEGLESVSDINIPLMILACITGCILGLAFVIPLRKQMIDFDRLPYPGGIATAMILKSPGAGVTKAKLLLGGALVSGLVHLWVLTQLGEENWHVGDQLGIPPMLNVTFYLSVMTIGVGFLSGKGGFWFGAGGFICYFILTPLLSLFGDDSTYKLVDPPIRAVLVEPGDRKQISVLIRDLREEDPAQAATTIAIIGFDPSATQVAAVPGGETAPLGADAESAATPASLFEEGSEFRSQAAAFYLAAEDLWMRAKEESDSQKRRVYQKPAQGILNITRAHQVQLAPAAIDRMSDTSREAFLAASSSKEVLRIVGESELTPEDRQVLLASTWASTRYKGSPTALNRNLFRPTGIGMLIGAAIGGLLAAFPLILSAFRSLNAARTRDSGGVAAKNDEMPISLLYLAVVAGAGALIAIAFSSVAGMTLGRALLMALLGTAWVWVAGVIVAECIGRTNWSPLSGMTLIAVTILILIAKEGLDAPSAVMASVVVGAAICLAISQASDMMLDLKAGYLVGAIPRRQQIGQFVGAWLGPCIVIFLLLLLHSQYEIGSDRLPAPQARALASMVEGIMTDDVPSYRYAAGIGLGGLLAFSGLGGIGVLVGLGFYMPFNIVLTYTIGNLLRVGADKWLGHRFSHEIGIPVAAGLIVGEALVGVGNALVRVALPSSESFQMLDELFGSLAPNLAGWLS